MGKCDVCRKNAESRVISGISFCEECFGRLDGLRKGDPAMIEYFLHEENLSNASQVAKTYIKDTLKQRTETEDEKKREEVFKAKVNQYKSEFMMTTGYNFEGYKITKYIDIVSGSVVKGTGLLSETAASFSDLFGTDSGSFSAKLENAKNTAVEILRDKCIYMGANAVIGVDFDYLTFSNNMIGVVANGTAVNIEKIS